MKATTNNTNNTNTSTNTSTTINQEVKTMKNAQKNINFTLSEKTIKSINSYLNTLDTLRNYQLEKSALNKKLDEKKITVETYEKKLATLTESIKTTNKALEDDCNKLVSNDLYNAYVNAFTNGIESTYKTTSKKGGKKEEVTHKSFTEELMSTLLTYGCILGNQTKQEKTARQIFINWCTPSRATNAKIKNTDKKVTDEFELLKPYGKKAFKKHFVHAFIKFVRDNKKTIVYDSAKGEYIAKTF